MECFTRKLPENRANKVVPNLIIAINASKHTFPTKVKLKTIRGSPPPNQSFEPTYPKEKTRLRKSATERRVPSMRKSTNASKRLSPNSNLELTSYSNFDVRTSLIETENFEHTSLNAIEPRGYGHLRKDKYPRKRRLPINNVNHNAEGPFEIKSVKKVTKNRFIAKSSVGKAITNKASSRDLVSDFLNNTLLEVSEILSFRVSKPETTRMTVSK